jgi:hypothetical protein
MNTHANLTWYGTLYLLILAVFSVCVFSQSAKNTDNSGSQKPDDRINEIRIRYLGEMRCSSSIEILIANIEFRGSGKSSEPSISGGYPCVEALYRIGLPSVHAILELKEPVPKQKTELMAMVVYLVDGYTVGKMRIENALETARGKNKKHLQALLKAFCTNDFFADDSERWDMVRK